MKQANSRAMPDSAPSPCTYPSCGVLVQDGSRCDRHPYERTRTKQAAQWLKPYKTVRWQTLREWQLNEHPLCADCMAVRMTTAATVVDHVIPHKGDLQLFFDKDNLQSLCVRHHNRKTAREDGGFGNVKRF